VVAKCHDMVIAFSATVDLQAGGEVSGDQQCRETRNRKKGRLNGNSFPALAFKRSAQVPLVVG